MLKQLLLAFCFVCSAWGASLEWNASVVDETHAAPTGYRIHRGPAPGAYDWSVDVGNVLQWPIPDDLYGSFYWTASAYNAAGQSGYSNEVFWQRAPPEPPQRVGATDLRASKLQQQSEQPMAISRLGTYLIHTLVAGVTEYAWSVDIPSGTDCIVILYGDVGTYSGNPLVSANLNGTQNFTIDQNLDDANDTGVGIGHLFAPASTGSQTINVTIGGHGYEGTLYLLFYSGVDTNLRDSDTGGYSGGVTLTTVANDYVVAVAVNQDNTSTTWSNATEIYDFASPSSFSVAIAELVADGTSETINVSSSSTYAIAAIVLRPASAGASAVPANRGNIGMMLGMSNSIWLDNDFLKPVGGN